MANRTKLTVKARGTFLSALQAGNTITFAARLIGMSRQGVYDARETDTDFRTAWDRAVDEGIDVLEQEAKRRAVEGVVKPIVQGGRVVTDALGFPLDVREYSDRLLEMLLKAKKPDVYRENSRVEHAGEVKHTGDLAHLTTEEIRTAVLIGRKLIAAPVVADRPASNGHANGHHP